jgi:hypothetical protein
VSSARARAGPGTGKGAHLGEVAVKAALTGKTVRLVGPSNVVHSWSYMADVCRTLATVGTSDGATGRAWHVPTLEPLTAQQMLSGLCKHAGVDDPQVRQIPRAALNAVGLVMPLAREMREVLYQFDEPFIIDGTDTTATFAIEPTPLNQQFDATIAAVNSVPGT